MLVLTGALLTSCHDDADAPTIEPIPGAELPGNFPPVVYGPEQNPPDRATFELGRSLFYDPQLSRDGKVSCGSCHQQFAAFAQPGHALSHGVDGRLGTRNSPALQNLRWKPSFMWDGGAHHIENQPIAPLLNPLEMDETLSGVLAKLNADASYPKRFAAIYKKSPIDSYQLLRALAQFTAALTSSNSRYDHYVRHEASGTLDAAELRGLALVQAKCASCHATDLFTDETFRNNGLNSSFPLDSGGPHHRPARRRGPLQSALATQRGPDAALHARRPLCLAGAGAGALRPRRAGLPDPRCGAAPGGRAAGHCAHGARAAGYHCFPANAHGPGVYQQQAAGGATLTPSSGQAAEQPVELADKFLQLADAFSQQAATGAGILLATF